MTKIAMAIHGGARDDSDFIRLHEKEYHHSLKTITAAAYKVLTKGGGALDCVELAVCLLEDDPLFNAGCGSALNKLGEIEMDASIMNGLDISAGSVAMVRNVKNPISLARAVMEKTKHVMIGGKGADDFARRVEARLETSDYFITDHQKEALLQARISDVNLNALHKSVRGTVGAVACDIKGNLAAATSTGGTTNCLPGRIGDSCIIGAGCYANNNTCAVSGTGDGEYFIRGMIANSISGIMEYTRYSIQEACDKVIFERNKQFDADLGVISIDKNGNIGIAFNSEVMHRAWISTDVPLETRIYRS